MKGRNDASEDEQKRREQLESLSRDEWEEGVRNFWRWFEKVKSWEEAPRGKRSRPSRD